MTEYTVNLSEGATPKDPPAGTEACLDCLARLAGDIATANPFYSHQQVAEAALDQWPEVCEGCPPAGWGTRAGDIEQSGQGNNNNWDPYTGVAIPWTTGASEEGNDFLVFTELPEPYEEAELSICNDTSDVVDGLVLFFSPARTRLLQAVVDLLDGPATTGLNRRLGAGPGSSTFAFAFRQGVQPGQAVTVGLTFIGDSPHLRQATWLVSRRFRRPRLDPRNPDGIPCRFPYAQATALARVQSDFERDLRTRNQRIDELAATGASHIEEMRFFAKLDAMTHPDLELSKRVTAIGTNLSGAASSVSTSDLAAVDNLGGYLWRRVRHRARQVALGLPFKADASKHGVTVGLRVANRILAELLGELPDIGEAFERFAGGELSVFQTHGVPNGVNMFAFAELALALREIEVSSPVVDAFVDFARAGEIFASCYHRPGAPRRVAEYNVADNPIGARAYTEAQKVTLRAQWEPAKAIKRYNHLVAAALYDEFDGTASLKVKLVDNLPSLAGRDRDCDNCRCETECCDPPPGCRPRDNPRRGKGKKKSKSKGSDEADRRDGDCS